MMTLGISVRSFLPLSCLILCSKTAELIINTSQGIAEKQVPKQRRHIADSFQNLISYHSWNFSSSNFEMLKLLKK